MAEPNLDKLNFYTGVNYMKRSGKSGQSVIDTTSIDIEHELGYAPKFMWFADLFDDGMIWYGGEKVNEMTESTSFGTPNPAVNAWAGDTILTLYPTDVPTSRPVYWLIYLDYGA